MAYQTKPGPNDPAHSGKTPDISDLLPVHIRKEIRSPNMSLMDDASLRNPKLIRPDKKISVSRSRETPEEITVYRFIDADFKRGDISALICHILGVMFEQDPIADLEAVQVFIQAMILLLGQNVVEDGGLRDTLLKGGVSIKIEMIDQTNPEEMQAIRDSAESHFTRTTLNLDNQDDPSALLLAYCGTILLLAGKQLTVASALPWTQRRVRGLAASIGCSVVISQVIGLNIKSAQKVYQKMSLHTGLRARFVRILLGMDAEESKAYAITSAMLNLLAWSEMNHIRMVQEFIFGRFPELLTIRQLQGHCLGVLSNAWAYMATLDIEERPYAKLLYDSNQTKALQRDRFILIIDAAYAVGQHLYSSFTNYQGANDSTTLMAIKKIVSDYLKRLDTLAGKVVDSAVYTTTDKRLIDNMEKAADLLAASHIGVEDQMGDLMRV